VLGRAAAGPGAVNFELTRFRMATKSRCAGVGGVCHASRSLAFIGDAGGDGTMGDGNPHVFISGQRGGTRGRQGGTHGVASRRERDRAGGADIDDNLLMCGKLLPSLMEKKLGAAGCKLKCL
jgi:hypothetical protein